MSLRFYFSPSDGALSRRVYSDIVRRSMECPDQRFLVIVPDQFTMQTQKELCLLHPRGGILNIDVLSFGRLSRRVLEEVGCRELPVLDDVGKSLVIQKVAAGLKDRLPVLGGFLHRQGYINEVKGAISEFMQYGISPKDMDKLTEFSKERSALSGKLKDLQTLYEGFTEYIRDHFVTAEETLEILRKNVEKSGLIRGSVIILDGFTGFTPIQNRLIGDLMALSKETILTLICGREDSPYRLDGEQRLFYLTKKTVNDLERLAKEKGVDRDRREDIFLIDGAGTLKTIPMVPAVNTVPETDTTRAAQTAPSVQSVPSSDLSQCADPGRKAARAGALSFLQDNLFRYGGESFRGEQGELRLFEATNPAQEVHQTALFIRELICREGMQYRDMALICGDLEGYAPYIEAEFQKLEIPCFIDRTRGIGLNPLTEFIQSALSLYTRNFNYESVMHYLRSGMSGIPRAEVDRLENYILETGIRGSRAYSRVFSRRTKRMSPEDETELELLNRTREAFLGQVESLRGKDRDLAANHVDRLYDFLVKQQVQRRLTEYAEAFERDGDAARAGEYAQIYRLVMELLNQIYQLLGEEEITRQEFADIVEAGFGEIQVGIIPQNVDRVLAGDMERTRFQSVKVLFFLGVNDGNIPRNTSKGGIISDMEREFLKASDVTLAPTPRQKMFIQRFYLYLNLTKPSQKLFLSYSRQGSDGKAIRPAYLIDTLRRMYRELKVEIPQNRDVLEQILTPAEGRDYLASGLRRFAQRQLSDQEKTSFFTLYSAYGTPELRSVRQVYTEAAFRRYRESGLSRESARLLYGEELESSVSRLETFAGCACQYFLKYGLGLREREIYGYQAVDLGNIYHGVLNRFAHLLEEEKRTWLDFDREFAERAVKKALAEETADYGNSVFFANSRNAYQVNRMGRILTRTALTLQEQLRRGEFLPREYEVPFRRTYELGQAGAALSPLGKMILRGRIDRVDAAEGAQHIYVKVVDYKSGNRNFDLAALYYGLQLQLVIYMNAALERVRMKHPEKDAVPAALLYYHVEDPMVEGSTALSAEELDQQILRSLRTKGIVNDSPEVVRLLDRGLCGKSDVIPVDLKKDGDYTASSSVIREEDLREISDFASAKIKGLGGEILDGRISLNPYEWGEQKACTYCPYSKVCGFDPGIPGCRGRKLKDIGKEEALKKMKEER